MNYDDDELAGYSIEYSERTDTDTGSGWNDDLRERQFAMTFGQWCELEEYDPQSRTYRTVDGAEDRHEILAEFHRMVAEDYGDEQNDDAA